MLIDIWIFISSYIGCEQFVKIYGTYLCSNQEENLLSVF